MFIFCTSLYTVNMLISSSAYEALTHSALHLFALWLDVKMYFMVLELDSKVKTNQKLNLI